MHFQDHPHELSKLVTCVQGNILDVVVATDSSSPYYNKPFSICLSEDDNKAIIIPPGYAHGFLAMDETNLVLYFTDNKYVQTSDIGVLWSSIDYKWPSKNPIISDRDASFGPI